MRWRKTKRQTPVDLDWQLPAPSTIKKIVQTAISHRGRTLRERTGRVFSPPASWYEETVREAQAATSKEDLISILDGSLYCAEQRADYYEAH
jgi:hypothetical protein